MSHESAEPADLASMTAPPLALPERSAGETNKGILRRFAARVWNERDLSVVDECTADGFIQHNTGTAEPLTKEGFKRQLAEMHSAFPDLRFTVDDLLADGDKIVARWTIQGTHLGRLQGFPPTGRAVTFSGMTIIRFVDGKAQEEWVNFDVFGMMRQIGVIPDPAAGPGGLLRSMMLVMRRKG
jgi:steroid delta-isomerase-like uncharacterized protein